MVFFVNMENRKLVILNFVGVESVDSRSLITCSHISKLEGEYQLLFGYYKYVLFVTYLHLSRLVIK